MARTLIASGALKPCHRARLYSGGGPPSTACAATSRIGVTTCAGARPTSTHTATSSSTGTRIQRGGSWGFFGRSTGSPLKKTSWMKRML